MNSHKEANSSFLQLCIRVTNPAKFSSQEISILASFSDNPWFDHQPQYWLSKLRLLMVFLSPSMFS